ncbi:MAG TPA: hypothetical protein VD971_04115, partial [Phycisphaerales bacterium]|nr:hypothetical protein [Phycisphaerales bacterium]
MKGVALSAALLAGVAGQAVGQVVVDGVRAGSEPYAEIWVNNQPTTFGDNVAGSVGTGRNGRDVTRGLELSIPMANIGLATGLAAGQLKMFIGLCSDNADLSNQIVGQDPLPLNSGPLGWTRQVNFNTIAGQQYLVLNPTTDAGAPTLDGTLDGDQALGAGGWWAGKQVFFQTNYTSQGDNTLGVPDNANGSELDNLFVGVTTNGTADPADDVLQVFLGGNFHGWRRLAIFIDSVAGGQNRLLNGNPNFGPGGWVFWASAGSPTSGDGLTFDAGFEADYLLLSNAGGGPPQTMYFDGVTLATGVDDGNGNLVGTNSSASYQGSVSTTPGALQGGGNSLGVSAGLDNSNVLGVEGVPAGQSNIPSRDLASGSEFDNLWAYVNDNGTPGDTADDVLHMHVAGNLETNYNHAVFFFDVNPTDGQNQLRGQIDTPPNPYADFDGLNRMGNGGNGATGAGMGLKFEADFAADYWLSLGNGNNPVEQYLNAAVLRSGGRVEASGYQTEYSAFAGGQKAAGNDPVVFTATYAECQPLTNIGDIPNTNGGPRVHSDDNATNIFLCDPNNPGQAQNPILTPGLASFTIDNNNIAGVTGITGTPSVAGAASVATGMEISIALRELGWDGTSPIKIAGIITSNDYGFGSNQVLGGIDGGFVLTDLGEVTNIDFSTLPGTQYVVVPAGGPVGCDSIDFNGDGLFPDNQDLQDFLDVFGGGACSTGTCGDLDFNNDGL